VHIKTQTVLPPGTKITRVPPGEGKARSVRSLGREKENSLEQQAEQERQKKRFAEARARGMSIAEAAVYAMGK
jgi:hypothetical protein